MLVQYKIIDGKMVKTDDENASVFFYSNLRSESDYLPLLQKYAMDSHTLHSMLDPDELARLDVEDNYVALICKRPHQTDETHVGSTEKRFRVSSLGIFLFAERLVIIYEEHLPLDDFHKLHRPVRDIRDVVLSLIYHATLHFYGQFHLIRSAVRDLEQKLLNSTSNQQLMDLFALEKSMTVYLSSLGNNNMLLERLHNQAESIGFSREQIAVIDDIMIDSKQCYKQAEVASEIMASMTDTTASLVNNKLSVLMKRLMVISLIFLPINAIAGIGGMSEFTAFATTYNISSPAAYGLLVIGLTGIAYITYFVIHKVGLD